MEKVISVEIVLLGKVFPGSRYEVRNHFLNTFQKLDQTFSKNLIKISSAIIDSYLQLHEYLLDQNYTYVGTLGGD